MISSDLEKFINEFEYTDFYNKVCRSWFKEIELKDQKKTLKDLVFYYYEQYIEKIANKENILNNLIYKKNELKSYDFQLTYYYPQLSNFHGLNVDVYFLKFQSDCFHDLNISLKYLQDRIDHKIKKLENEKDKSENRVYKTTVAAVLVHFFLNMFL